MNILVTLLIAFMMNGSPQVASFESSSVESCLQDIQTASTAIRDQGGTVVDVVCVVRPNR